MTLDTVTSASRQHYIDTGRHMLRCDMATDCLSPVSMIDAKGFVYCRADGLERRAYQPCRKLRPWELRKLERGEQLARY